MNNVRQSTRAPLEIWPILYLANLLTLVNPIHTTFDLNATGQVQA